MSPLRVGINLLWMVPGEVGGTEEAVVGFLRELAATPPDGVELSLFGLSSLAHAHPDVAGAFPSHLVDLDGRRRPLRVAAESTWLAREVQRAGIDLVHHYGGTLPLVHPAPSVLTVHDIQVFEFPAYFAPLKRRWLQSVLPRSIDQARIVMTPSEFVRRSLVDRLGTDPAKVRVAWHGVDLRARRPPTAEQVAAVRDAYRLAGPVVLYPAITYPHKNHVTLVRAFAQVAGRHRHATLVLSGGVGSAEADVEAEVERSGLGARVRRVGRLPRADLDVLLHTAEVLAFPSRYEGFGLPLLEAMADGAAVVASGVAAAPEVVGDAGVLLDPDDVDAWASTLDLLLSDPGSRRDLVARGHARVGRFGWRQIVRSVVDVYAEAAGRPAASAAGEEGS